MKRLALLIAVFLLAVAPVVAVGRQTTFVPYSGTVVVDEWMHYENRNTSPTFPGTLFHNISVRVQGKTADGQVVVDVIVPMDSWRGDEMFPGGVVPTYDGVTNFGGTSGTKVLQRSIASVQGIAAISGPFPRALVWTADGWTGTATGGGAHTSTFEPPTIAAVNVTLGAAPPSP